jgi:maltose alpha-D-glucosyltransferase/alpha-amylase
LRDYYVWSDTDQKYKDARIIFVDTQKSNWTWEPGSKQYYWHRFYESQPDLNYDNPAVQREMLNVVKFWADLGVDGFRADAVPYLFERDGTNCENLPETHAYLKRLRKFMDENYPGKILLCEANQWPEDVRPYFGDGDEFHMGFHFPVMPRIYMALRKEDKGPLEWILKRMPPIPPNCQWCVFLRNHDELTLEMVTEDERQWMWQQYAPEPRMRLNLGIRRRLASLLDNDRRKIELANSLLFTLPGSPIIYYGDEIGMGDDIWLPDRNGVRTPMQWEDSLGAGFSRAREEMFYAPVIQDGPFGLQRVNVAAQRTDPNSLWHAIRRMILLRKAHPTLGWGDFALAETGSQAVVAYWRRDKQERLLIVHNLSEREQNARISVPREIGVTARNLLADTAQLHARDERLELQLKPYQSLWLSVDNPP